MEQPPIPPQIPVPPHAPPVVNQVQPPPHNPGQTTGIIGLILAFVGLAPIGLVLAIISTVSSRKAKASAALGIVGIVFNALAVLSFIFFVLIAVVAYNGVQGRADDSAAQASAATVEKKAEQYFATYGLYPQKASDFEKSAATSLRSTDVRLKSHLDKNPSTIVYIPCGKRGAAVLYYSTTQFTAVTTYLGTGSVSTCDTPTETSIET